MNVLTVQSPKKRGRLSLSSNDSEAPRAWHWRPVRVDGHSMIAVFAGGRVVALFGAHDIDDAHALVTLRNGGRAA